MEYSSMMGNFYVYLFWAYKLQTWWCCFPAFWVLGRCKDAVCSEVLNISSVLCSFGSENGVYTSIWESDHAPIDQDDWGVAAYLFRLSHMESEHDHYIYIYTHVGWWFGPFFPYIGNNNPNWLIFFQRGWNHQPVYIYICIMNIIDHLPSPSQPESTRVPTVFPVEIAGLHRRASF